MTSNDSSSDSQQHPPAGQPSTPSFQLEVDGDGKDAIGRLRNNISYWVARGRFNKVRIKRNGKPILPDIPVGALVAFEAATFFWTGLLRGVLVNTVGRVLFEVELINEADDHYRRGLSHFLSGEMQDAKTQLEKALRIDGRHPRAHLQMGVIKKVEGKNDEAIAHFERVLSLDAAKKDTALLDEARAHLKKLKPAA